MSNKGKIFVGSSLEAADLADKIVGQLVQEAGMELVPWRTIFPPNTYPLEVFEKKLVQRVSGAILLATPDVFGKRGNASFKSPVPNIALEYGYLAARLGRNRLAICEFDDVSLPSDLNGLTTVKTERYQINPLLPLPEKAKTQLQGWLETLSPLAEDIPPTRTLHGYSGRWDVQANFSLWRGWEVDKEKNEQVVFNGLTILCLDAEGMNGFGMQKGILSIILSGYRQKLQIYNEILGGHIDEAGKLTLTVKVLHRIPLGRHEGKVPDDLGEDWLKKPEQAPPFEVFLEPDPNHPLSLRGWHPFIPAGNTHQQATETWKYSDRLT